LIRTLSRFSERALLILSGGSDPNLSAVKIGPALLFERLWQRTGLRYAIKKILSGRNYEFDVERAILKAVGVSLPPTIREV
jgi:hypothetical protein